MMILEIDGELRLDLSPEDCFRLSQACDAAVDQAMQWGREDLVLLWGAYATTLEALGALMVLPRYRQVKDLNGFGLKAARNSVIDDLDKGVVTSWEARHQRGEASEGRSAAD